MYTCIHTSVYMQTKIYGHVYIEPYKLTYDTILYVKLHDLM